MKSLASNDAAPSDAVPSVMLHVARQLLRSLEWNVISDDGDHWHFRCPSCHAQKRTGHVHGCRLGWFLKVSR